MMNFFNSNKYQNYLDRLRAQVGFNFVLLTGASQLLGLLFIISDPNNYQVFIAEVTFSSVASFGSLVLINRGWYNLGIRVYIISMMFYLFLCTYLNGMLYSMDITALLVIVFVSGVLIDKKESGIYFAIITVFLIALYFVQVGSGIPPNSIVLSDFGQLFWILMVLISAGTIQAIVNQPILMLFSAIDLEKTEKQRYMTELEQQNKELERINKEYRIEKERANLHSKLQSAFLSNMSQEVRVPMLGILRYASRLGDTDLNSSQEKQFIALLQNSTKELLLLMNEIVDKSKIESEQLILNPVLVSILTLTQKVEKEYCDKIKDNVERKGKLAIVNEVPKEFDNAIFDEARVSQILQTLISHVGKSPDVVEILLRVSIKENVLIFTIKALIANNDRQKVGFSSFGLIKGEDNKSRRRFQGSMGLSIAQGLANLMNGKIEVINEGIEYQFSFYYRGQNLISKT